MSKFFSLLLRLGESLEDWRVMLISAFNYVIVEVVAEIGKNELLCCLFTNNTSFSKMKNSNIK